MIKIRTKTKRVLRLVFAYLVIRYLDGLLVMASSTS